VRDDIRMKRILDTEVLRAGSKALVGLAKDAETVEQIVKEGAVLLIVDAFKTFPYDASVIEPMLRLLYCLGRLEANHPKLVEDGALQVLEVMKNNPLNPRIQDLCTKVMADIRAQPCNKDKVPEHAQPVHGYSNQPAMQLAGMNSNGLLAQDLHTQALLATLREFSYFPDQVP